VSATASAVEGKAFDVVTAGPVNLGAPDSPRASLAHYFDAVREGRWEDATRYLELDATQRARGAQLAQRLKAVIDDTGWIDLETLSDAHEGHTDGGLPLGWRKSPASRWTAAPSRCAWCAAPTRRGTTGRVRLPPSDASTPGRTACLTAGCVMPSCAPAWTSC
jgi:hypothetical protein